MNNKRLQQRVSFFELRFSVSLTVRSFVCMFVPSCGCISSPFVWDRLSLSLSSFLSVCHIPWLKIT